MTDFYVEVETTYVTTFQVTAASREDALDRYESGEAELIDEYDSTNVEVWEM